MKKTNKYILLFVLLLFLFSAFLQYYNRSKLPKENKANKDQKITDSFKRPFIEANYTGIVQTNVCKETYTTIYFRADKTVSKLEDYSKCKSVTKAGKENGQWVLSENKYKVSFPSGEKEFLVVDEKNIKTEDGGLFNKVNVKYYRTVSDINSDLISVEHRLFGTESTILITGQNKLPKSLPLFFVKKEENQTVYENTNFSFVISENEAVLLNKKTKESEIYKPYQE